MKNNVQEISVRHSGASRVVTFTPVGKMPAVRWSAGKSIARVIALALVLGTHAGAAVEGTWAYAVQVSATVSESPALITLSWPTDTTSNYTSPTPTGFTIYRKAPGSSSWGTPIANLGGTATSHQDTNVSVGTVYDYKVVKDYGSYKGHGYVRAAIKAPLVDDRGKVVVIKGLTVAQRTSLASEITRLEQDLVGDGWTVISHDVLPTDSVSSVKSLITTAYSADPTNVKAVFLFGRVPVPYSGQLYPDGHPNHEGAWPADVYYGEMDGSWTDNTINHQTQNGDSANAARLTNTPGDGKFDQSFIASEVELEVGRVDLANLPGNFSWDEPPGPEFPSETELLRGYLNKDHNFRHRVTTVQRRAIIGDYVGVKNGEAFAASGYRSFAPLVGAANIRNLNDEFDGAQGVWLPAVTNDDYLLSYACGLGSYWSVSGAGSSTDTTLYQDEVVFNDVRIVFSLMCGSEFGDWDNINTYGFSNNLLRSILATPTYGLVSAWSGRPHWFIHPMGLGETIGYCARLTQNNTSLYENQVNNHANKVHVALMGDPTLRLHPIIPVPAEAVQVASSGNDALVSWTASGEPNIEGYHVYRSSTAEGPFTRLTMSPVIGTSYTHVGAPSGAATYMVRTIKLEGSPSGSYYNASQGAFWSGTVGTGETPPNAPSSLSATAVSASQIDLSWTDNSSNETGFLIERSSDGSNFIQIASVAANTTVYPSTGLSASTIYYYRVRATNSAGNSGYSNTASATTDPGASTWTNADIGAVSAAGSYSESGGTFTVNGSGADIWETADEFHFVYQQKSGDGTIIARVNTVGHTHDWAKAGIMIRENLSAGSPNAMMLVGPANNSALTWRGTSNALTNFDPGPWSWLPTWIKLERAGNVFTAYQMQEGGTWDLVGTATIPMASTVYVGLAVTSHNDGTLCTATLDNVSVAFGAPPPSGWTNADIGAVSAAGSYSESGGTLTVIGSGADIWETADEFHFVYQQKSGDGTIVARVNTVGHTHDWAKAGIMIRDNLSPGSPNAMMMIGPVNNSALTWRSTSNALSDFAPGPWSWLPTWIKLERAGSVFTAYQMQDAGTWDLVGTVTISMASTVYVGLAVTSHNDGTLCTATLDNVSLTWP